MKRIDSKNTGLVVLFVLAGALLLAATAAMADDPRLPAPQQAGAVVYVTGGVSEDQSAAFKQAREQYPLSIELLQAKASGRNEFTSGAQVQVQNAAGATVLQAAADGPYMLVQVPPGSYRVSATLNGRSASAKTVSVGERGNAHTVLMFPDGTD